MAGNSSSSNAGQSVFSLDTQADVMQLLAAVRVSELAPNQKNELRDLVFLYTNGGHDESVQIALQQKLATFNLKPLPAKASNKPVDSRPTPTIGTFRNTPDFAVSKTASTTASESTPKPQAEPQTKTEKEIEAPTPEVAPASDSSTAEPAPQPVTLDTVQETEVSTAAGSASPEKSLERIKEIKALVNEKVGNPVHLVDKNPTLGREYMSALLEAMKKVNSGSAAASAMERLEAVYLNIKNMDTGSSAAGETPAQPVTDPSTPIPEEVPVAEMSGVTNRAALLNEEEESATPIVPTAQKTTSTPPVMTYAPAPTEPERRPVVDTPAYQAQEEKPSVVTPKITPISQSTSTKVPLSQTAPSQQPNAVPITSTKRSDFATDGHDEIASSATDMPAGEAAAPNPAPISPIASLSNPLIKGKETTETSPAAVDSLHSPEIDKGLAQLLEEWPIFKKSGLFGTGPKGKDHPLFKKVADLQIPLLLAGRFEGATQEIKQSITDYMNGWRYEQGLIYEQGETFEHYLRRVIKHILDMQKYKM